MTPVRSIFFLVIFLSTPFVLKAEEQSAALQDVSRKLLLLESKMKRLSETQNQILLNADKIDQELISLGIKIRRHRG